MIFWILWIVGIAITVVAAIQVRKRDIMEKWLSILVIISFVLVGGIADGFVMALFSGFRDAWIMLLLVIVFTWLGGILILGLFEFELRYQLKYLFSFLISVICWSFVFYNYFNYIERNTETIVETIVTDNQDRQLLYFCNVPVQDVSGTVSGSFHGGNGKVSGSISTLDELSYWYVNENDHGIYDSAPADSSRIIFIESDEMPHLEIISYCTRTREINHINGKESITNNNEWTEYNFYLPEEIMQYQLE